MEAGRTRTAENPHRIKSDLSNLTMIHSCNWSSCNSKLDAECFSRLHVLQTGEGGAECVSLSSDSGRVSEPFRLGRRIPFMFLFFFILPSSRSYLFWPAQSTDSATKDIKHTHTSTLTLTHILMFDSFVIYRQYLWDDKDSSVCAFARFQSSFQWNWYSRMWLWFLPSK